MSLLTFLKKLWIHIEAIFQTIPSDLKTAIATGVNITENIKNFINSPAADVLTTLIPGSADDATVAALRTALPSLLTELKLTNDCLSTDNNTITKCGVQVLQQLSGDVKSSFLHTLSILLAQVAADGKLTWQDGVYLLEWYYNKYVKAVV